MFKIHTHGALVFITSAMQQGLFLVPNAMTMLIIMSCMARAQELYSAKIVAYSVSTTHIHMIMVIDDPDMFKEFMRHFKAESAHALNNILGVPCRNLWNEGYDSPIVLDAERAIKALAYTYANQVKDNLVDKIEQYPVELNSFKHAGKLYDVEISVPWIPRSYYEEIPEEKRHVEFYAREARRLKHECSKNSQVLRISPYAWLDALGIQDDEERRKLQARVIEAARLVEKESREKRAKDQRSVFGMRTLSRTPIGAHYTPRRRGRRTYVISTNRNLRKRIISKLKILFADSKDIRNGQRKGSTSLPYPNGIYPAPLTKLLHPLSIYDMVAGVD